MDQLKNKLESAAIVLSAVLPQALGSVAGWVSERG
jgi:hypothetical protein